MGAVVCFFICMQTNQIVYFLNAETPGLKRLTATVIINVYLSYLNCLYMFVKLHGTCFFGRKERRNAEEQASEASLDVTS